MQVVLLGLDRRRTTLALREDLIFPPHDLEESLRAMGQCTPEGAILSTCHRVEIYAAAPNAKRAEEALARFWSEQRGVARHEFEPFLYRLVGRKAIEHLFSVACGLDSAIIGEPQILGQVREALQCGLEQGSIGRVLSALFRQAIATGRRARNETGIGRNAASVGSAAVELAKQTFGDLQDSRVLLVGAGEMGQLAARNLLDKGAAGIAIVGRRLSRARALALRCGSAVAMSRLEDGLLECDIVITSTNAPHHVVRREMVVRVMRQRGGRQLFLIDIAVPRDVEPSVGGIAGVHLYNIDDLESMMAANVKERRAEARKVAPIVAEDTARFQRWLATQSIVPTIVALREQAEAIRQEELARTAAVLSHLPERDRQRIEALTLAIEKKLLHHPITMLRSHAAEGNGKETNRAVRELFGLDLSTVPSTERRRSNRSRSQKPF